MAAIAQKVNKSHQNAKKGMARQACRGASVPEIASLYVGHMRSVSPPILVCRYTSVCCGVKTVSFLLTKTSSSSYPKLRN